MMMKDEANESLISEYESKLKKNQKYYEALREDGTRLLTTLYKISRLAEVDQQPILTAIKWEAEAAIKEIREGSYKKKEE